MSKEFKKGDRVKLLKNVDNAKRGMIGTCMDRHGCYAIPVEFDEKFKGGHSCNGRTREGHGHWIRPEDLELFTSPHAFTLVITSKGDRTKAKLLHGKEIVQTAEVNRYKDDEYSQPAAIHAIIDKMFPRDSAGITKDESEEPEDPPKFTGKAVCLNTGDWFTKGRIYDFTRGFVFEDRGHLYRGAPDDYDGWKKWFDAKFIAIVNPEDKA